MITPDLEHHTQRIAAALAETRVPVREEHPLAWQLQPAGLDCSVNVRLADDWILLGAPLEAAVRAGAAGKFLPLELLEWNAALPGGAKFAVDARFNLSVRAEVPLLEDEDPGPRVLEGWNGIETALARFHSLTELPPAPAANEDPAPDLQRLAGETGWAFNERQDRLSFDLPAPAGSLTATLHARERAGARLWVPLAGLDELSTPSRHALAVLLLRAGAILRFARPAFATDAGKCAACLEVIFDSAPLAAELTQALESLAVGVALAALEAQLLCQEQNALEYLTVGTWPPRESGNNNNKQ